MGLDGAERFRLASTSTTLSARSGNRRSERLLEPNRSTPRDKVGTSLAQKTGVDYTSSVENESPPSLLLLVLCPHCALAMNFLRRLDDRIRLRPAKGSLSNNSRLSNHDLDPVKPEDRTWTGMDVIWYWTSDQFSPATWEVGSSLVALGITARVGIPLTFFGFLIISFVITLHGRMGSIYHVPFPVLNRSAWGVNGVYFAVVSRSFLALMWLSILTLNGGQLIQVMTTAIWPSFANFPNHLPESSNISSALLLSFFIYWIIQTPLSTIPVPKLKWLFLLKGIIVPPSFIAMGIWGFVVTKGGGDLISGPVIAASGYSKATAILSGLNASIGLYSTLSINVPDFTRFSKTVGAGYWQIMIIPVSGTIPVICAYACANAAQQLWGVTVFDPASLIQNFDSRAAQVFAGFAFCLSLVGVNISANSVSFATDVMALCPRYLDLFRGAILSAILAVALTPWNWSGATAFVAFLSNYSLWLGCMGGIIITDLYIIRKQHLSTPDLYTTSPTSPYSYPSTLGINPRAFIAFACGFGPDFPGFLHAITSKVDNPIPTSNIGWVFGFGVSALVYWACWIVCPGYLGEMEADGTRFKAIYPDDEDCMMVRDEDDESEITSGGTGAKEKDRKDGSADVYEV